ncbi:cache domain-containing sensor histidine kinase [Paenibacillus pini]|uniref:Two-component sensor histidine kinase n=1 Tax=Paenibacillus pini JCM 16418 TaxID=1236976 RepID=W7YFI5_9BACL|nr:sensor histidine kinase [Paenibacillus pini]GAF07247.1 two-component sensor histidine kinase [Paenibacillus pini JCM 16418]
MNLRVKLLLAFVILIIVPLCILGAITFIVTSNSIEEKYSRQTEYSLKAISYSISNVFKQMDNVTDSGIGTSVFHMALNAKDPTKQDLNATEQLNLNASQRNFRNLLYNHPSISYAFLYNLHGNNNIVSIFNKEDFAAMSFNKFKEQPLYKEVTDLNAVPKWLAPHEYPEITGVEPVFTQIRLIKEISTLKNIGILVVQIKSWDIESIFRNLSLDQTMGSTHFMLVNDDGLILFDPLQSLDGQKVQSLMNQPVLFEKGYQSFKADFNHNKSIVSMYHLKDYPWSIISVTSWDSLSKETRVFAEWFIGITLLCLFAAVTFNVVFMNRITGSIAVIVRFMRRVEGGDFKVRVEDKGKDELHVLSKGFNDLVDKINLLFTQIQKEQKQKNQAELRVLQAQIKPHFLFNTLESINVLAMQNEGAKVSEMVYRLGNILRISIQGKEVITLEKELDHLRSYLEIQKFRFEDVFDYEIDVPKDLLKRSILKLTLQPLVENSIQHGFEGISYKGMIRISCWSAQGKLILQIEDNGIGIGSEQLLAFEYMSDQNENTEVVNPSMPVNHERRGLGVRSVADRIRIHYGDIYGLFICSSSSTGTIIRCIVPNDEWGEL